jgi:hypothetical protein
MAKLKILPRITGRGGDRGEDRLLSVCVFECRALAGDPNNPARIADNASIDEIEGVGEAAL